MSTFFGNKVREIRKRIGLTQQEFATQLGYSDKSMIAHIENGDNEMSIDKITLLLNTFNINANELFDVKKDIEPDNYIKRIRQYVGHQKIFLNAAGGIVVKDEKVLLQRRKDNGKWGLVGGMLEINETYLDGALREIKEETGLDVKPMSFLGIFHNYNMVYPSGDQAHVICACYVFEIIGGTLRKDEESLELRFFSKEELPKLFAEDHKVAIKRFFDGIVLPILEENRYTK